MKALTKGLLALSVSLASLSGAIANAAGTNPDLNAGKCSSKGYISVVGQGEVKVDPDLVRLNYRVSAIKDTPEEARVEVEKTVEAFSKAVAGLKLEDKSFIADNISIMPRYQYNEKANKQELSGYEASRNVDIKLSDFSLIAQINTMAMDAGINHIAGFEYSVKDKNKYEIEAAKKAIEDAKVRAQVLADGFNVKLGMPCSIEFGDRGYVTPYRLAAAPRAMMAADTAAAGRVEGVYNYEAIVISASVNASFAIEPAESK